MDIHQLLTTDYETLPMEVRHQVLGEAAYYLDKVIDTGRLPNIKGYYIFPVMNSWCEVNNADYIEACLAGIWYMGKTGRTVGLHDDKRSNVLSYLDRARTEGVGSLHYLLGLSEPLVETYEYRPYWPALVKARMHMLRQYLPIMDMTYRALEG